MRHKSSNMVGQSLQIGTRNSINVNHGNFLGSPKALFRETKIDGSVLDNIQNHLLTFSSPSK